MRCQGRRRPVPPAAAIGRQLAGRRLPGGEPAGLELTSVTAAPDGIPQGGYFPDDPGTLTGYGGTQVAAIPGTTSLWAVGTTWIARYQ